MRVSSGNTAQMLAELGLKVVRTEVQKPRSTLSGNSDNLLPEVIQVVKEIFPTGLYRHQAKAVDLACRGENVVICTGTASGKTVVFALPVFQSLLKDPQARAIFFYPTKALSGDQRQKLEKLAGRFGLAGSVYPFDGDTPYAQRLKALKRGRILLCTPDVLHATMLRQSHDKDYAPFFANLKWVILDECHIYSGAFGSNMAYLVRRLRQVCRRFGSEPQFLAASATSKDPQGHLERLTGAQFQVIGEEDNGSPSGGRDLFLTITPDLSEDQAVIHLVAELVHREKSFIVFSHSRKITEHCDPEAEAFDRGCPACIHVPRWYEDNEHLSKVEALALLAKIREVVANYVPKAIVSEAYRGRREGLLTSVADLDKMDGEVTLDEIKQGAPVIAKGSIIALRSGQRGTILGWRLENSQVIYEAKLDSGKTIALRNTGGNITLVQGEQSIVCLGCGADGIAEDAFECPVCGEVLR
ncbi:ATP-dependent RNA helicase DeaD [Peptococcaceae bacterium CEB3]|nr:ATP-dependent RNA helicase DeaD [Peptococcaceae bacterium CEB3]